MRLLAHVANVFLQTKEGGEEKEKERERKKERKKSTKFLFHVRLDYEKNLPSSIIFVVGIWAKAQHVGIRDTSGHLDFHRILHLRHYCQ